MLAEKAVERHTKATSFNVPNDFGWALIAADTDATGSILQHAEHELAITLMDNGGPAALLSTLRICARFISRRKFSSRHANDSAALAFIGLGRCLVARPQLLGEVLRGNLIKLFFSLSPWYENIATCRPNAEEAYQDILWSLIQCLTDPETILYVAKCVRKLSVEIRNRMSFSHEEHIDDWDDVERFLMDRLITLRVHLLPQRVVHCDSVSSFTIEVYQVQYILFYSTVHEEVC